MNQKMKHTCTSQLAKVHIKDNRIVLIRIKMIPHKPPNIATKNMYCKKAIIYFHLKKKNTAVVSPKPDCVTYLLLAVSQEQLVLSLQLISFGAIKVFVNLKLSFPKVFIVL